MSNMILETRVREEDIWPGHINSENDFAEERFAHIESRGSSTI